MLAVVCPPGLFACSAPRAPAAWSQGGASQQLIREADAFEEQGRYTQSRAALARLQRVLPADRAMDVGLRGCSLWRQQQQPLTARRCYLELAQVTAGAPAETLPSKVAEELEELRAIARYRAAVLGHGAASTREEQSAAELHQLMVDLPHTDAARRATHFLRRSQARHGRAAEISMLVEMVTRIKQQKNPGAYVLALELILAAIELSLEGDHTGVSELLGVAAVIQQRCATNSRCQDRGVRDDLWYWRGRYHEQQGEPQAALRAYTEIVKLFSNSLVVGSTQDNRLDDGLYRLALLRHRLMEEATDDSIAAKTLALGAYDKLLKLTPTSPFADDAALARAKLIGTVEALKAFVDDYPHSPLVAEARRLIGGV